LSLLYAAHGALADFPLRFWDADLFWRLAATTVTLIFGTSLYKVRAVTA